MLSSAQLRTPGDGTVNGLILSLMTSFPPIVAKLHLMGPNDLLELVAFLDDRIQEYWQVWQAHPDFNHKLNCSKDPNDPVVAMAFKHEPGKGG